MQVADQPAAMMGYGGVLGNVGNIVAPPATPGIGIMSQLQFDPAMWMPPVDDEECLSWLGNVDWTTQGYFTNTGGL